MNEEVKLFGTFVLLTANVILCGIYILMKDILDAHRRGQRYADVCLEHAWRTSSDRELDLLLLKVVMGRSKAFPLDTSVAIEPTPNCHCHIPTKVAEPTDDLGSAIYKSQVYFYEYDEDYLPVERPRQCLPYSIVRMQCNTDVGRSNAYCTAYKPVHKKPLLNKVNIPKKRNTISVQRHKMDSQSSIPPPVVVKRPLPTILSRKEVVIAANKPCGSMSVVPDPVKINQYPETCHPNPRDPRLKISRYSQQARLMSQVNGHKTRKSCDFKEVECNKRESVNCNRKKKILAKTEVSELSGVEEVYGKSGTDGEDDIIRHPKPLDALVKQRVQEGIRIRKLKRGNKTCVDKCMSKRSKTKPTNRVKEAPKMRCPNQRKRMSEAQRRLLQEIYLLCEERQKILSTIGSLDCKTSVAADKPDDPSPCSLTEVQRVRKHVPHDGKMPASHLIDNNNNDGSINSLQPDDLAGKTYNECITEATEKGWQLILSQTKPESSLVLDFKTVQDNSYQMQPERHTKDVLPTLVEVDAQCVEELNDGKSNLGDYVTGKKPAVEPHSGGMVQMVCGKPLGTTELGMGNHQASGVCRRDSGHLGSSSKHDIFGRGSKGSQRQGMWNNDSCKSVESDADNSQSMRECSKCMTNSQIELDGKSMDNCCREKIDSLENKEKEKEVFNREDDIIRHPKSLDTLVKQRLHKDTRIIRLEKGNKTCRCTAKRSKTKPTNGKKEATKMLCLNQRERMSETQRKLLQENYVVCEKRQKLLSSIVGNRGTSKVVDTSGLSECKTFVVADKLDDASPSSLTEDLKVKKHVPHDGKMPASDFIDNNNNDGSINSLQPDDLAGKTYNECITEVIEKGGQLLPSQTKPESSTVRKFETVQKKSLQVQVDCCTEDVLPTLVEVDARGVEELNGGKYNPGDYVTGKRPAVELDSGGMVQVACGKPLETTELGMGNYQASGVSRKNAGHLGSSSKYGVFRRCSEGSQRQGVRNNDSCKSVESDADNGKGIKESSKSMGNSQIGLDGKSTENCCIGEVDSVENKRKDEEVSQGTARTECKNIVVLSDSVTKVPAEKQVLDSSITSEKNQQTGIDVCSGFESSTWHKERLEVQDLLQQTWLRIKSSQLDRKTLQTERLKLQEFILKLCDDNIEGSTFQEEIEKIQRFLYRLYENLCGGDTSVQEKDQVHDPSHVAIMEPSNINRSPSIMVAGDIACCSHLFNGGTDVGAVDLEGLPNDLDVGLSETLESSVAGEIVHTRFSFPSVTYKRYFKPVPVEEQSFRQMDAHICALYRRFGALYSEYQTKREKLTAACDSLIHLNRKMVEESPHLVYFLADLHVNIELAAVYCEVLWNSKTQRLSQWQKAELSELHQQWNVLDSKNCENREAKGIVEQRMQEIHKVFFVPRLPLKSPGNQSQVLQTMLRSVVRSCAKKVYLRKKIKELEKLCDMTE